MKIRTQYFMVSHLLKQGWKELEEDCLRMINAIGLLEKLDKNASDHLVPYHVEQAKRSLVQFYHTLDDYSQNLSFSAQKDASTSKEYRYHFGIQSEEVFTVYDEKMFFVRCGMLPEKNDSSVDAFTASLHTTGFYATDVGNGMNEIIHKAFLDKKYKTLDWAYKTINFLFVYPKNRTNGMLMDSDNHYTKKVHDAIAMRLSGDGSVFCSVSYQTEISDVLPEGTYIIVSKGTGSFLSADDIISRFEEVMLNMEAMPYSAFKSHKSYALYKPKTT